MASSTMLTPEEEMSLKGLFFELTGHVLGPITITPPANTESNGKLMCTVIPPRKRFAGRLAEWQLKRHTEERARENKRNAEPKLGGLAFEHKDFDVAFETRSCALFLESLYRANQQFLTTGESLPTNPGRPPVIRNPISSLEKTNNDIAIDKLARLLLGFTVVTEQLSKDLPNLSLDIIKILASYCCVTFDSIKEKEMLAAKLTTFSAPLASYLKSEVDDAAKEIKSVLDGKSEPDKLSATLSKKQPKADQNRYYAEYVKPFHQLKVYGNDACLLRTCENESETLILNRRMFSLWKPKKIRSPLFNELMIILKIVFGKEYSISKQDQENLLNKNNRGSIVFSHTETIAPVETKNVDISSSDSKDAFEPVTTTTTEIITKRQVTTTITFSEWDTQLSQLADKVKVAYGTCKDLSKAYDNFTLEDALQTIDDIRAIKVDLVNELAVC